MNKNEFIDMCIQDAGNDNTLLAVVDVFKEVIPDDVEIDSTKDPKGFYDYMKEYARKKQKGGAYCITPDVAKQLAVEYLKLNVTAIIEKKKTSQIMNLEDFF